MEMRLWNLGSKRLLRVCVFVNLQGRQAERPGCSSSCCAASPSVAASWSPTCREGRHLCGLTDRSQRSITKSDTGLRTKQSFGRTLVCQMGRSNTLLMSRRMSNAPNFSFITFHLLGFIQKQNRNWQHDTWTHFGSDCSELFSIPGSQ